MCLNPKYVHLFGLWSISSSYLLEVLLAWQIEIFVFLFGYLPGSLKNIKGLDIVLIYHSTHDSAQVTLIFK